MTNIYPGHQTANGDILGSCSDKHAEMFTIQRTNDNMPAIRDEQMDIAIIHPTQYPDQSIFDSERIKTVCWYVPLILAELVMSFME